MEKKQINKMLPIGIAALIAVVAVVVVCILFFGKKEAYRIIKVYEVNGEATVTRESVGEMEAYQNMVLESGDKVSLKSGEMTLKLDEDKFVYVEADTQFQLIATGSAASSKTSIELDHGAITNEIQNALGQDSSYEVNTPNSNMSVRGTVFRVYTYFENGVRYSKVSVFEGKVESRLRYPDGSLSDKPVLITNGNEVLIYDDESSTDYVGAPKEIAYQELPKGVKELLSKIFGEDFGEDEDTDDGVDADDSGDDENSEKSTDDQPDEAEVPQDNTEDDPPVDTSNDDGAQSTEQQSEQPSDKTQNAAPVNPTPTVSTGPYTVTFMYNGSVFGTQTVKKGELASEPRLMPSPSGSWDFDFNTKINSDTTIEWR